jgi:hypothetical protein
MKARKIENINGKEINRAEFFLQLIILYP